MAVTHGPGLGIGSSPMKLCDAFVPPRNKMCSIGIGGDTVIDLAKSRSRNSPDGSKISDSSIDNLPLEKI